MKRTIEMEDPIFAEAIKILLSCATQYYCASGLHIDTDGKDGYGPLREARLFVEKHGTHGDIMVLDGYRHPSR